MDWQELKNIINQGETQYVEFKLKWPKQGHEVAKKMAAFANSGGGILLMGVENDGTLVGIENPLQVDEQLAGVARTLSPPLCPKIGQIKINSNIAVAICIRTQLA